MNIFYLDPDPEVAAAYHCDKHVVCMIKETVQMMSTAHRMLVGDEWADRVGLVKSTHYNHPSTIWVRSSVDHYHWMLQLLHHLCDQKLKRFGTPHVYTALLQPLSVIPDNIDDAGFTQPPACMPDEYKEHCSVQSYRFLHIELTSSSQAVCAVYVASKVPRASEQPAASPLEQTIDHSPARRSDAAGMQRALQPLGRMY